MEQALDVHRFHFAFTVTFHYIFPQLTMGLEASRQPAYATRVAWSRRALRNVLLAHKNKYGQDYENPTPTVPVYAYT